jgi:hypothetical protein
MHESATKPAKLFILKINEGSLTIKFAPYQIGGPLKRFTNMAKTCRTFAIGNWACPKRSNASETGRVLQQQIFNYEDGVKLFSGEDTVGVTRTGG